MVRKRDLFRKIFSVQNEYCNNKIFKVVRLLGIKMKFNYRYRNMLDQRYYELQAKYDDLLNKYNRVVPMLKWYNLKQKSINKEQISFKLERFDSLGVTDCKRKQRIIVSLTSYPERMYDIHYCLYSLLTQDFKPDEVVLWLAPEQFPNGEDDIPEKVLDLKKNGLTIKWHYNLKSYTKLIPSLKEYPNDVIVTADDDIYYNRDWLEKLYNTYLSSDKKTVIAHRCHRVNIVDGQIRSYNVWKRCCISKSPSFLNFLTGVGGVLYPPKCFYKDILNEDLFKSLTEYGDDIWFWAMCILNNTKIRTVAEPNSLVYLNPEREICLYDETTLFSSNITNNDAQIENVLNYYPEIRSKLIENNVKVSIIIPVYNVENELKQCLDSVCNQTLKDIEIICINDGSTDRSPEILNEYAQRDSRIKVINNSNSGAAVSRNIGLSIAKGEYIGFVDGDDWVDENYYSSLYYTAFYSGADVARCTYKYCYPDCVYNSELNHIIEKRSELGENLHVNEHSVVIWNAIYRLDFLKENGICYFNQDLKMCHDIPFTTRVDFLSGKTVPAVGTNYYYRKGRIGQLVTPSIERLKYSVKANMYVIEFLNSFANIEKNDYIVAYKRVLNRFKGFYNDYKSHEDFSSDVEKEFMKKYQEVCDKCKYPQELQIPVLLQEICA